MSSLGSTSEALGRLIRNDIPGIPQTDSGCRNQDGIKLRNLDIHQRCILLAAMTVAVEQIALQEGRGIEALIAHALSQKKNLTSSAGRP